MERCVFLYRFPHDKSLDDLIGDLRETGSSTGMVPECRELQELLRHARKVESFMPDEWGMFYKTDVTVWVPPNSLGENLIMMLLEYTVDNFTGGSVTLLPLPETVVNT